VSTVWTRALEWWKGIFAPDRMDAVMAVLQKAGDKGLTLGELIARTGYSRSQVDRALRKLRDKGLVEKNGDRWKSVVPK